MWRAVRKAQDDEPSSLGGEVVQAGKNNNNVRVILPGQETPVEVGRSTGTLASSREVSLFFTD